MKKLIFLSLFLLSLTQSVTAKDLRTSKLDKSFCFFYHRHRILEGNLDVMAEILKDILLNIEDKNYTINQIENLDRLIKVSSQANRESCEKLKSFYPNRAP